MAAKNNLKVLYLSDSLGTPIHARGIFNYSISLVEILKRMGADLTLVVEQIPGYGVPSRLTQSLQKHSAVATASAQLSEIYRYFHEKYFSFNFQYQTKTFRFLAEKMPPVARLAQKIEELFLAGPGLLIENDLDAVGFVPPKGEHLRLFDRFLFSSRFYSSSMSRAVNGMDPIALNAKNYDLVVIDTPHFVRVYGIDPNRILAVVHDLIPLSDPTMNHEWKHFFLAKVLASNATGANLVFVSECTRQAFFHHFPDLAASRRHVILYPTIRTSLMTKAATEKLGDQAEYMQKLIETKATEFAKRERELIREERQYLKYDQNGSIFNDADTVKILDKAIKKLPCWNPDLPYFVTALSDELRKNIGILVQAFSKLKAVANMVIVGEVDGNKYVNGQPDNYPNVHFTGYISEADKLDIIYHSAGMIFPSFSEGFGIPIVEGAVLGVPVLCSDIPVFREIGGIFATYFDPYKPRSLELAIRSLLENPKSTNENAIALQSSVMKRFSQNAMAERLNTLLTELGAIETHVDLVKRTLI